MDLLKLQEELREKALQRSRDEKAANKAAAPAAGKVKGPIIDFRYRPNTKSIIGGIAESPIFRAGLIANGVDIDEFYSRARTMPEIIADLKEHNVIKAVVSLAERDFHPSATTLSKSPSSSAISYFSCSSGSKFFRSTFFAFDIK